MAFGGIHPFMLKKAAGAGGSGSPGSDEYIEATSDGTVTTDDDYKVHVFTASGTFEVTNAGNSGGSDTVELLVVAGGGGTMAGFTSGFYSGGGGAGGYRSIASHTPSSGVSEYDVVVGAGGGTYSDGNESSVDLITATGGGRSAGNSSYGLGSLTEANAGGSGGGGCYDYLGANASAPDGAEGDLGFHDPAEGYRGGNYWTGGLGAPGGGSSAQGPDGFVTAANGTNNDIVEATVDVLYATGGNGRYGAAGGANTGDGGGGEYAATTGGSGIVVIRYKFQN